MMELRAIAFDDDGVELVGQMAVPQRPGPHPAVMVMHTALGLSEMMCPMPSTGKSPRA